MKLHILLFMAVAFITVISADNTDEFEAESEEDLTPEVTIEEEDFPYTSPVPSNPAAIYLAEHFDDDQQFHKLWVKSQAKKEGISEDIAKYDGEWALEAPARDGLLNDKGLVLKSKAKHAAISSRLTKPFVFNTKPLIVQYEVNFQQGQECGGAYLKLLSDGIDTKNLVQFHDKTPYTIMFGPDKCGTDHKLHFIFRHKNPKNGTVEEKHCKKPKERYDELFTDKMPHLFTLIINPDNTYEVQIDKKVFNEGSLLEDFTPSVNPPAEIEDPSDKKPEDWDEREKIPDPEAKKPDDWDEEAPAQIIDENAAMPDGWLEMEPQTIPDVNALKPADWDNEIDGEWEPPLIENPACANAVGCGKWEPPLVNNPEYKGKWKSPLIDNPNYKGKWRPRMIPNPDYYEDKEPFKMHTISAVGFELWSMSENLFFDNVIITDSLEAAQEWAAETYDKKRAKITKASASLWGRMLKHMNYRPKAWAAYFVYCLIPISIYISYLVYCYKEESVFERIASLTNDYPALWAVYILVLGIPVVFILYLCCRPSSSSSQDKEEQKRAANVKKTDQVTADDDVVRGMSVQPEEGDGDADTDEKEKYSGDDDEDDDDEDEEEEDEEAKYKEVPKKEEPVRKRKARKE